MSKPHSGWTGRTKACVSKPHSGSAVALVIRADVHALGTQLWLCWQVSGTVGTRQVQLERPGWDKGPDGSAETWRTLSLVSGAAELREGMPWPARLREDSGSHL